MADTTDETAKSAEQAYAAAAAEVKPAKAAATPIPAPEKPVAATKMAAPKKPATASRKKTHKPVDPAKNNCIRQGGQARSARRQGSGRSGGREDE